MNMLLMSMTLEVSQLDMSAVKFFKSLKSPLISVMAETSQSAMGPYVAIADVAFALKARTATFRETVLVKVPGGDGGEGGSNGGEGGGGGCRGGSGDGGSGTHVWQMPSALAAAIWVPQVPLR